MADAQRERLSKTLDYTEKGSAYYVMQKNTVSRVVGLEWERREQKLTLSRAVNSRGLLLMR